MLNNRAYRQHGYISILNIAIFIAIGALLYITFSIFSGFLYNSATPYTASHQVHSAISRTDNQIDNQIDSSNNSVDVIYSSYKNGSNQTSSGYNLQSRSNDRAQQQLSAAEYTNNPESQAPVKYHDKSSQGTVNSRSSRLNRNTQAASQTNADNNPSKIGAYGSYSISGQVIDQMGWPVSGIEVIAKVSRIFDEQTAEKLTPGTLVQSSITNSSGTFHLPTLAEGEYKVETVISDYYPSPASLTTRTGIENVKLVLTEQRTILIYGTVENAAGEPLSGVEIVPFSNPDLAIFTNRDGYYNLNINVKGNAGYTLQFWADGYQEQLLRLSSMETQKVTEIERSITLKPDKNLVSVSGSLSSSGSAISGERVYLKSSSTKRKFSGVTDSSGKFTMANVEAGNDYILWVSPQGPYELYRQNQVIVPVDGLSNLAINLKPMGVGNLTGQMIDLNGNPVPNFTLFLRSKSSSSSLVTVTGNSAGYFTAESVPKGELVLGTSSLPKLNVSGIMLQDGDEKEVELILDIGSYQLLGQITDNYGDPIPAANVVLSWVYRDNGITYESIHKSTSTSNGDFRFSQLGPGERTLSIAAPGYEPANILYGAGISGEQTVSVQLEPKAGG
ncbi:carboxypeptidase-like regulatory domain-containing protein [Amphritea sp. HPY]|uniref:carboxypeptidase-like regulatory domain-containing protein n=1 Tax=Amphritea sp. HPY TaxID=3421652 RepID=UPI003D7DBE03